MKKNKIFVLVLVTALMAGVIGTSIAYPTEIFHYEGTSHTGCHGSSGAASTGTLTVTPSTSGRLITLTATIQGFTEALESNNNRSGTFAIGIPYKLGNNKEFGLGISENTVNGDTDYWGIAIWEIDLDASGNTVNPLTFRVLAPEADGLYNLIVAVVSAFNSTGDPLPIIYFHEQLQVTVTSGSVSVASLAFVIPFNSVFLYVACGIVASGAVILLIKRKRK
ncbi:MAG: hypothetical protein ACXAEX_02000 [Promethearchaeota archaeon]|jgi:hypothetical protein